MPRTGRPREFDEHEVVEQAKQVFWARGYERTSVQELVDATGVQRGSLYGAFGDKQGLFLRALGRYGDEARAAALALDDADPVLPALRAFLMGAVAVATELPDHGCLLANTVGELVPHDAAATDAVRATFTDVEAVLRRALERARAAGELPAGADPAAQAPLLLVVLQGLRVVAKADADPARLAAAVDAAVDGLG